MQSTPQPETSAPPENPPERESASQLERVKKFFDEAEREGAPQAEGDESHESPEAETEAKPNKAKRPKTLKDVAERLALGDADLYDVEIPMPNGKPVKLGALKDAHAAQDAHTVRELEFAERVSRQEADWTRAQQEFNALVSQLDPKAITPQMRERVRKHVESEIARERKLTLEAIPAWQDEALREKELAGMVELLRDYGITDGFLLASANHKLFRFVRDAWLRKVRVEAALKKVETVKKPSTTGRSSPNGKAAKPETPKPGKRSAALRSRVLGILE